jgi:hypothetical protein
MFSAKVTPIPEPSLLTQVPTGKQLMSGPISSGVVTRAQKETQYVLSTITHRMNVLITQQDHDRYTIYYLIVALISGSIGTILMLFGLRLSVMFDYYSGHNYLAVAFGALFYVPLLCWFIYLCFPNKEERQLRRQLNIENQERKRPTAFNDMVNKAKKFATPPARKILVVAVFRKKNYNIVASTMKEFCEAVEAQTGLPIERQLVRHMEEDLELDLAKKLDEDYQLHHGSYLYVYNKGGYMTQDSPIKRQYEVLTEKITAEMNARPPIDEKGRLLINAPEADERPRSVSGWISATRNSFRGGNSFNAGQQRTLPREELSSIDKKNRVSWKV